MAKPGYEQYESTTSTPEAQEKLVSDHTPLVKRIAYHLKARLPACVIIDDLYQAGMIGLLEAGRKYSPREGASFETYAGILIRGAMLDELRKNDWTPKSVHRKNRELSAAIRKIENREGRDARDQEIADELGITLEEYNKILKDNAASMLYSLDTLTANDGSMAEGVPDESDDPVQNLQNDDFKQGLARAISGLPERERLVISFYYDNELNLREIGKVIGVSESRISQLLSQALARVRARLHEWI